MILIFAPTDDPVAEAGARGLARRGAEVVRWDAASFPARGVLSMRWDRHGRRTKRAVLGDREVRLDDVRAVWHRRMAAGRPSELTCPRVRSFVDRESTYVLKELANDLHVPFVPAPWAVLRAKQAKLMQLTVAGRLGLEVPPTIVTNDPDELRDFHREHGGRIITKHVDPWALEESDLTRDYIRFTLPVTRRDRMAFASARLCPVFAQAYVPKRLELRITLVGDRLFAAEIHSQSSNRTRHDWRHQDPSAKLRPHQLPDDVAGRCCAMARELGLRYGAFDFVLTPDGRYVFLEINPGGEFHWVEVRAGLPITAAIVDLLLELAADTETKRRAS